MASIFGTFKLKFCQPDPAAAEPVFNIDKEFITIGNTGCDFPLNSPLIDGKIGYLIFRDNRWKVFKRLFKDGSEIFVNGVKVCPGQFQTLKKSNNEVVFGKFAYIAVYKLDFSNNNPDEKTADILRKREKAKDKNINKARNVEKRKAEAEAAASAKEIPNAIAKFATDAATNVVLNVAPNAIPGAAINAVPHAAINVIPDVAINVITDAAINVITDAAINPKFNVVNKPSQRPANKSEQAKRASVALHAEADERQQSNKKRRLLAAKKI